MNREKDFHKKASGVLINRNTNDYKRARNRNKVMKTAVSALGEGGELSITTKKVDKFINEPSRAEERVNILEEKIQKAKDDNDKLKSLLDKTLLETEEIKNHLIETNKLNQEMNDTMKKALIDKNDFLKIENKIKDMEKK